MKLPSLSTTLIVAKLKSKRVLVGLSFLLVIAILILIFVFLPTTPVKNVFVSNVSDHSATISWVTDGPVSNQLLVQEKFSALEVIPVSRNLKVESVLGQTGTAKKLHTFDLTGLHENTTYYFRIYQNYKTIYQGSFKTGVTLASLATPDVVYGRIYAADKKTPLSGVLIYFKLQRGRVSSSLASTTTNHEGRWSIDLANIRTRDLTKVFPTDKKTVESVVVDAGAFGKVRADTLLSIDQPWPDIYLMPAASSSAVKK